MNRIIEYLKKEYAPLSVIVYGSYADGSQNENSDFDALVISEKHRKFHDVSFVEGIQLDVFVYPQEYFQNETNYEEFVQIFDGKIVLDKDGCGVALQNQVLEYLKAQPGKTAEDLKNDVAWCKKMALRTERNDAEGMFRWHWLLTDSLEIFCDLVGYPYRGPKKSLRWMEKQYPEEFQCYISAMERLDTQVLREWVSCLEKKVKKY